MVGVAPGHRVGSQRNLPQGPSTTDPGEDRDKLRPQSPPLQNGNQRHMRLQDCKGLGDQKWDATLHKLYPMKFNQTFIMPLDVPSLGLDHGPRVFPLRLPINVAKSSSLPVSDLLPTRARLTHLFPTDSREV